MRKNPDQVGFAVQPRRWVVERFFAWIGRNRRLAKDFEATIDSARAFLYAASVMLLVRRIARLHDFRNEAQSELRNHITPETGKFFETFTALSSKRSYERGNLRAILPLTTRSLAYC